MLDVSALWDVVLLVPATFWGVLAGSAFTLGGVYLTNRANDRRLIAQFEHERDAKRQDMELSMRRDIYLDAVECVNVGLEVVTQLSDLGISNERLVEQVRSKSAAAAKIHLVAGDNTIRAFAEFTSELSTTYLRLMIRRAELLQKKADVDIAADWMDRHGRDGAELVQLMKKYNLEGQLENDRWAEVNRQFALSHEQHQKAIEKHQTLATALHQELVAFTTECVREQLRIRAFAAPALLAARAELGLPLDLDAYLKCTAAGAAKTQDAFDQLVQAQAAALARSDRSPSP